MNKFLVANSLLLFAQVASPDPRFLQLKNQLERVGWKVVIELPPKRGAYGLLREADKKIWINPVVFDLNIANQTLIHEAVHAAQVCAGKGKGKVLGLRIQHSNHVQPFFLRYRDVHRQDLEREAYAVQSQTNSFELAVSLLQKYCK